ncbi:hypothetical protein N7540_004419 [Penicillium herquei]|nr:hypothetical protein N7540_004419 [Penicillium herquei]
MDHTYLFCLIMGVPAMWSTRKLRSRFTKAQNIVHLSGLAMYAIGLLGFFLRFLWEAPVADFALGPTAQQDKPAVAKDKNS